MSWLEGIPHDSGINPRGSFNPVACILHRTYGSWGGDYAVGKGTGRPGIGFHFLVGKNEGQWVQFYSTNTKCNHAAGANSWSIGIEFTGINEEPLTDWQVRAGANIIAFISTLNNIPLELHSGGRYGEGSGFRGHAQVAGSDHGDYVTKDDWNRMLAAMPNQTEDKMYYSVVSDYVVNPENPTQHYLLDCRGGIHSKGGALPVRDNAYWGNDAWPWDMGAVAIKLIITNWSAPSGYTIDVRGGVHPFGNAPVVGGGPYFNGRDGAPNSPIQV